MHVRALPFLLQNEISIHHHYTRHVKWCHPCIFTNWFAVSEQTWHNYKMKTSWIESQRLTVTHAKADTDGFKLSIWWFQGHNKRTSSKGVTRFNCKGLYCSVCACPFWYKESKCIFTWTRFFSVTKKIKQENTACAISLIQYVRSEFHENETWQAYQCPLSMPYPLVKNRPRNISFYTLHLLQTTIVINLFSSFILTLKPI